MHRFYTLCLGLAAGLFFFTTVRAEEPPVTFPEGWKVTEEVDGGDRSWSAEPKQGLFGVTSIDVDELGDTLSETELDAFLGELSKETSGTLKRAGAATTCGKRTMLNIAGAKAASVTCKVDDMKVVLALLNGKKKMLMLSYWADEADYEKYLPEWRKVLESIKIR